MPTTPRTPTARERLRVLLRQEPGLTATDVSRRLGISRQRATKLADEEGLTLATYTRSAVPAPLTDALEAQARRTLASLRETIRQAVSLEKRLTKQLTDSARA